VLKKINWYRDAAYIALRRPKLNRQNFSVSEEYSAGWSQYAKYLDSSTSLDDWFRIKGYEDPPAFCNIDGKLSFQSFDSMGFNRLQLLQALKRNFPNAKSITEYGCGVGRNLLFLKKHLPHLECYGYELCQPGVEIAQRAAEKFGLDVKYSRLDYVEGSESEYVFPQTEVAFTMYSLEQLPNTNKLAVENILRHTVNGSIHIEPVTENYPNTLRGLIARLDHWKADYLKDFEKNISNLDIVLSERIVLGSAHSPLMFPTLYVTKKMAAERD